MKHIRLYLLRNLFLFVYTVLGAISIWGTYHYLWLRTTIKVDGKDIVVRSEPITVSQTLRKHNIKTEEKDIVEPKLSDTMPKRGIITITRVKEVIEKKDQVLPLQILWEKKYTRNLRPVKLQKCIEKKVFKENKVIYHDNHFVSRETIMQRETEKTIYRLLLLNKDDVVQKIYDLSKCKKIKMIATAYYPGDPLAWKDGTVTFLGMKMQRGIVAVDPKVIPLRTRVYIPDYGYGFAGDTGSVIKKNRIDLGVNNAKEEKKYMHRPMTVYILEQTQNF